MKNFLTLFFTVSFFTFGVHAKPTLLENVPLKWKATTELNELINSKIGSITAKINFTKFKDARTTEPKNKIGENTEDGHNYPVTTTTDIIDFASENFKTILKKAGLDLVDSGGKYTLTGEITDYFIKEVDTYQGSLIVNLTLSKAGKVVWKGAIIGTNTRFGRSYKLDNYLESISDTLIDFTTKLAKNTEFKAALK